MIVLQKLLPFLVTLSAFVAVVLGEVIQRRRGLVSRPSWARSLVLTGLFALPLLYVGAVSLAWLHDGAIRFAEPRAAYGVLFVGAFAALRFSLMAASLSKTRVRTTVVLTSAALLMASFVLLDLEFGRPLDRMTAIVVVDRSRSIDLVPNAEDTVRSELLAAEAKMRKEDRIAKVVFGAEAATEDAPRVKTTLSSAQTVGVGRDGSNIASAIRHSLAELPSDTSGRIVLVTDGVETSGDALSVAASAVAANVPIDVLALEQRLVRDVRVVSVRAPARIGQGEPIDLRIVTASAEDTEVEVRLKRDGEVIHRSTVKIAKGEDLLRLREVADVPGLHRYDVEVSALDKNADESIEDNVGSAFVRVKGASLALVVEGDPGKGAPIRRALESLGLRVVERSTASAPADIGEFAPFDLVVWSDVRASDISPTQIDALSSYVKDLGGGVLFLGGDRSYGPGGYAGTSVEEISPVSFDLKEQKKRASLAEVILIDYSGSMGATVGGQTKLALANEAAARSAGLLGAGDRLGVAHVDTIVTWTVPLGPVANTAAIATAIRKTAVGGGGIYTDLALRAGYEQLSKESVNLKHVLLFADGSDAERLTGCRAQVANAFARGITTSVISLGRGSDSLELEALSKAGNGRFYLIEDATRLPAVFTQETILASKGAISEKPFAVGLGSPMPATRNIDFKTAPPLLGYVITLPKPRATVGLTGPEGDPILATWSVGLGHATAFMSDYKDRWGNPWLAWPSAAKMFGQAAQDVARGSDDPKVRIESDITGGELHVRADAVSVEGRTQSFRRLVVQVAGPDGFTRELPLDAVGAGRYSVSAPLTRPGTYVATLRDEATGERVGSTAAILSLGDELRPTGSDRTLLTRIASITGGKVRTSLEGLYDDRPPRRFAYRSLSLPLTIAAAIALLLAVAARRLGVPDIAANVRKRMEARKALREARVANREKEVEEERVRRLDLEERSRELILASKRRHAQKSGVTLPEIPTPAPSSPYVQSPRPPTPSAPDVSAKTPPPTATKSEGAKEDGTPGAPRAKTTAERLAEKRRQRH